MSLWGLNDQNMEFKHLNIKSYDLLTTFSHLVL